MSSVDIVPPIVISPPVPAPIEYNMYEIRQIRIELNVSATIIILLKNESGETQYKTLVMEQPDYSEWGTDDSFVYTWINQQLHT